MASAYEHAEVIETYLTNEVQLGHILGPFERHAIPPVHVSGFGVISKRHQTDKWRLIVDLSSPDGNSVNDGIDRATCSLSYVTVDDIAQVALQLGRGALIAKTDIRHAYRQVPVHPEDRSLLAMCLRGQVFVDSRLPFGLRSAPMIFSAVADALEWVASQRTVNGTRIFHYIDDFVVVGPPRSDTCASSLLAVTQTCDNLGVLIAPEKTEGPTTRITVLGIEFDTLEMVLRLPDDKLERVGRTLSTWRGRRSGTRRDLESLAGTLQNACSVVRPGRFFMRRIYDLLAGTHAFKPFYMVRLNVECQADIEWWATFVTQWNGVSLLRPLRSAAPDVEVWSDASGSWGCGAMWQSMWFQVAWGTMPIATKSIAATRSY